jgi:hypothetical protein
MATSSASGSTSGSADGSSIAGPSNPTATRPINASSLADRPSWKKKKTKGKNCKNKRIEALKEHNTKVLNEMIAKACKKVNLEELEGLLERQ